MSIIALVALFACNTDEKERDELYLSDLQQQHQGETNIIYSGNSVYAKFFDNNVEREAGYYSTKANCNNRDIVGFDKVLEAQTKSSQSDLSIFVDGVKLNSLGNPDNTKSGEICDNDWGNLYGKKVSFRIGNENLKSGGSGSDDVSMYIPHIIDINYPVASTTELQPLCPFDDLLVEWNKDENNENGVVIIVEWDGDMIGTPRQDRSIRTIDVVDDTGEAILNTELFKDMPDLAMISITILRGNIDIVELENSAVKICAASNSSVTVVLAKEPI